jgi:hypothetical protein
MFLSKGTQKPPLGARVNPEHPFSAGLLACIPFNDEIARFDTTTSLSVLSGTAVITAAPPPTAVLVREGAPILGSNRDGRCLTFTTADNLIFGDGAWLPTAAITITAVRRKLDTTNRSSGLFGPYAGPTDQRVAAHLPYSDGTVYWDFGGNGGANRISVAGLTFSTTIPERWVFTAGPRGSNIWQNGVKVASQATAITRNPGLIGFLINQAGSGATTNDVIDLNYFAVYSIQWNDELCKWWSAEPYAHLYQSPKRSSFASSQVSGIYSQVIIT